MIWFTSDTHFGHENVLKFTDRPWETIWQMNDAIVDNINGRVAVDDELYILGDFSFKMTAQDAYGLRKRIACRRIHLVPGNHDKDWTQPAVAGAFTVEPPICVLKIQKGIGGLRETAQAAYSLCCKTFWIGKERRIHCSTILQEKRS